MHVINLGCNYWRGGGESMMGNFGYGNMMNWAGFGFGWLWMLLWWVLIILVIVSVVKWLSDNQGSTKKDGNNALDILKERYAKGEITKEQFEQMKKDIVS